MRINFSQLFRAFVLVGFAAFFIHLYYTGDIEKFINPKYVLTSQISAVAFVLLSIVQLTRVWETKHKHDSSCSSGCDHHHHHDSGSFLKRFIGYAIISFPLFTGFFLDPVTLDASIAAKKSMILTRTNQTEINNDISNFGNLEHQTPMINNNYFSKDEFDKAMEDFQKTDIIHMDDNMYSVYYDEIDTNPKAFIGKKIKMNGFVYKEDNFNSNQLVLARFHMIHCVADTSVIGFLNEFDEANKIEENTWLEIEGTIHVTTYNDFELPAIKVEKWTVIEEPDEPYIYPAQIQLAGGE